LDKQIIYEYSCIYGIFTRNILSIYSISIERISIPFWVDSVAAEDDEGHGICPQYLTKLQCYGETVKTLNDVYDINDNSTGQDSKRIALTGQQHPVG